MLPADKTFRVFISSTFNDLLAERNALQGLVFPRLRKLCQRYGARFQAVDLRWGVSAEAGHEQDTMTICLGEIARCQRISPRPNFLLLLGQRYGWRPLPAEIPDNLFRLILRQQRSSETTAGRPRLPLNHVYRIDRNARPHVYCLRPRRGRLKEHSQWATVEREALALMREAAEQLSLEPQERLLFGASATEQETFAGALSVPKARKHVHFFFRTISGLPHDERARDFLDFDDAGRIDHKAARQLRELKRRLRSGFGDHVHEYTVPWAGNHVSTRHLAARGLPTDSEPAAAAPGTTSNLCRDVYASLAAVIERELSQWRRRDALAREIQQHERFGAERGKAEFFTGRQSILRAIDNYLGARKRWPLTVHGASGSGKSALLARAAAEAKSRHPGAEIVFRFLGVTPESSNARGLLEGVCRQIASTYGDRRPVPAAYLDLQLDFPERLSLARPDKPLLLFLDALDQLSDQDGALSLNWLPQTLPDNVHVVVSTLADPCLPVLKDRYPKRAFVALPGLRRSEGRTLLDRWLKAAGRGLRSEQRGAILASFAACPLPLWLKLAFEESRRRHSYDGATAPAASIPRLVSHLFDRLARPAQHGALLVARSLALIGSSKNGLTEDELLDLLSQDREFFGDFLARARHAPPERRLPVVVWSRLFFDLEPYLTEREGDGTNLLGFFHRQFREGVERHFLRGPERGKRHAALARYFAKQPDRFADNDPMTLNLRKLSELPHQQRTARQWAALARTLCDLAFVEAKCAAGLVYDLIADYDAALQGPGLTGPRRRRVEQFARFVRAQSHLLAEQPALTFQQAMNEPDSTAPAKAARRLIASGLERRPHLRRVNKSQLPSPCLFTCIGHRDIVNSCDVSPDGRTVVSASSDGELKVWDAANGRELRSLRGHRASVETCAFSPDGRQVVSGGRTGEVKLWDAATGAEAVHLAGHRDAVATCAFSPDGLWLASASYDDTLRIWRARDGQPLHTLRGHKASAVACAFSPDGARLVSGASDGSLKVWDVATGRETLALAGHNRGVWKCAFSPDGRWIVSSSEDNTVRRWDARTGKLLGSFVGHRDAVWTCALSPDGRRLATGSKDKTVRLWEVESGRELVTFAGHAEAVWGLAFFADGSRVVSASWDRSLKIWDASVRLARTRAARCTDDDEITAGTAAGLTPHGGPIISCACAPDGKLYAAGCSDGSVRLWDSFTGSAVAALPVHNDYVTAVAFSPDGRWLLAGGWDGALKLIDVPALRERATLERHHAQIRNCSFSADGSLALSCSAEKVRLWRVTPRGLELTRNWRVGKKTLEVGDLSPDGTRIVVGDEGGQLRLWPLDEDPDKVRKDEPEEVTLGTHPELAFCTFSPDGRRLLSSSGDGKLKLWDVRRGRELREFTGHTGKIESCRFSPDGRRVVSSSWDNTVKVWSLDKGTKPLTLAGHTDQLQDSCFTADGKRVLSVGMDGTFRVWDASNGTELGMLVRPAESVAVCAFSRDGALLVSASHRQALKLWESAGGTERQLLRGHESDILACAFSRDGRRLVSASADNTLKLWDTAKGVELATLTGHRGPVAACAFSPDGRMIASGSWDGTVRLWDARLASPPRTLDGHRRWVQIVLFSPDGRRLLSCSQDRTARVWEVATGKLLHTLGGHRDIIEAAAFAPDGRRLVTGCADGTFKMWSARSGSDLFTLSGHGGAVRSFAFSPGGSQILSASNDKTLKLWDVRTGRLRRTLDGHEGPVLACAFSGDGHRLLSASTDRSVRLWDAAGGEQICSYWVGVSALSAAWHPNGRTIAVGDSTGQVHFLELI